MFAPASSRTVPRFHFSTFTALTVCCSVSSEDFRIAEGVTGAAGASCAGVPLAGACTADATEAEQTIVNINTAWLISIFLPAMSDAANSGMVWNLGDAKVRRQHQPRLRARLMRPDALRIAQACHTSESHKSFPRRPPPIDPRLFKKDRHSGNETGVVNVLIGISSAV